MDSKASRILGIGIMILSGAAAIMAMDWPLKAKLFPLVIAIPVFCMAAAEVIWGLLDPAARSEAMEFKLSEQLPRKTVIRRTLLAIAWMLGFLSAIVLLGFPLTVALLVFVYVKFQGREGWFTSVIFTLVVWAFFYAIFDRLLHLPFPAGWIQTWIGLG